MRPLAVLGYAKADALEQGGKALKLVLRPAVKRLLVTLGALDADAQERVAELEGPLLPRARGVLGPVIGHCRAGGEVRRLLRAVVGGLFLDVVLIAPPRLAADAEHNSSGQFVIGHIFADSPGDPLVPVPRILFRRRLIL